MTGAPSKIDRWPAEARDKLAEWRQAGRTIDELMALVREVFPGIPVDAIPARSSFGRYVQGLDRLAEKVQRSRAIADALVRRLGDAPESRQARLNIELMHGIVTELAMGAADSGGDGEDGHPVTFDPEQVHFLAASLDHLARASRADLDATFRLRKELAAEQNRRIDQAAASVADTAREAGLSAARVAELQAKVAGLRIEPRGAA